MQLIMHTIDELTAGGAANAATLGPDRTPASLALRGDTARPHDSRVPGVAHLAKLSRLMLRKLHQHSTDMGEQDTLLLTQVLLLRMPWL